MKWAPRSLFGRLVFVQIAYGVAVLIAFALIAEYTHARYHYKTTQIQARDWASHVLARHPELEMVRDRGIVDAGALGAALQRLGNGFPGATFYVARDDGTIVAASTDRTAILRDTVDMTPVRTWLSGSAVLPVMIADPSRPERLRVFSAAQVQVGEPGYLLMIMQGPEVGGFLVAHSDFLLSDSLKLAAAVTIPALLTAIFLLFMILSPIRRINRTLASLERAELDPRCDRFPAGCRDGVSELDQLSRDVDAMARRIVDLFQRLRDEDRSLRDLFATLSHDLRTPLMIVKESLEALSDRIDAGKPESAYFRTARMQLNALERMLLEQFELATLQRPEYRMDIECFALDELVRDVAMKFEASARERGLDISASSTSSAGSLVEADVRLIERVLDNLVDNAIRHAEDASGIVLETCVSPNQVEVHVLDDGPGMPAALVAWLQGGADVCPPRVEGKSAGNGLGLKIVRRIVELHGGRLWVENGVAGGVRIGFALPRNRGG